MSQTAHSIDHRGVELLRVAARLRHRSIRAHGAIYPKCPHPRNYWRMQRIGLRASILQEPAAS